MDIDAKKVTFNSNGVTLLGDLYLPRETSVPLPGLVVTGSWLTVKEQMPAVYAARLAAEGYAALAFDFRGWGQSEGDPRYYESPALKARDIRNAAAFLQTLPAIAPQSIGALAVCASSGYAAVAASEDPTFRSIVMVAPWLHNAELVRLIYGGEQGVRERLEKARAARAKYESTRELEVVVAASEKDPSAAMFGDFAYYLDAKRGAIKSWDNKMAVMSWTDWLEFDAIRNAPKLRTPTLLVHSENAAIPDGARAFHAAMTGPKQILWTDGDQFAFYDQEPQVSFSVNAAAEHFRRTLR